MSHRRRFPNQPARRASNLSRSLFGNRSRQRLHRSDRRSLHFETFESRCVLASVSGGVYLDANNDGLQGTGELGIPGVQIALLGADTSGNNVNLTTLSKNDGTFVFSNLAAGTYQLREAQANSFTDGKDTTTASGATAGQDEITNLVLTAEQSLSGNLFGQRALKPEYLSIAWFFASTPADTTPLIREVVAIGEERAGHTELAESIRNDQDSTDPDNPNTNRPPVATNDSYSTVQGQLLEITVATGVLANDTDADANPLTATLVQGPSNGTVVLRLDGSFTYTPNGTFSGTDTFTYQARDTTSVSNTATVSISVALRPNRFIIPENSDRGTTVGSVEPPAGVSGTLSFTIQDPALPADLVVRPDDHVIGEFASPMTLIQYIDLQEPADAEIYPLVRQLESEFGGELLVVRRHRPEVRVNPNSQLAAIAAEAAARQDAFDDMIDLLYDRQSEWSVAGDVNSLFLNYATELDLDVDQFEMDLSSSVVAARVQRDIDAADRLGVELTPAFYLNGQLLDNEDVFDDFAEIIERELADFDSAFTIDRSTGELYVNTGSRLDYESQPLWSLTVLATNPSGVSTPIAVTVTLTDINESTPIANNDTYSGFANTPFTATAAIGVLANDIDEDNLMITAQAVTPPAHGTLNLNTDGSFAYVPDADFTGMDSFTYIASDGTKNSAPATVTINVQAVNTDGVVAQNDLYTALRNTELQIGTALGVLANDTHAVGTTLTAQLVSTPEHGTVAFGSDGSFFYNPAVNFTGTDTFSYRATDGVHQSEVTTVTINVVINNRPPVALNDNYAVDKNLILTIPASSGVLVNDTDPDNDNLTTQLVSTTTFGSLVLNANGSFTYVPLQDYAGTDSFTYRAVDGLTTSGIATVTLTVNATNAPPIAVNDAYELDPNSHFEITLNNGLLLNDFDEDDDPIQAELVSNVSHGQLELRADGTFTYVSTADFTGTDTFTYRISDGSTNSAAATVTLNIREENVFSVLEGTEAGAKIGQVSTLGQAFVGPRVYQWHGHETQFPAELYLFPNDHLSGNPRAGVTLIAYMDFQSSTDRSYHQSLRSLEANQNSDLLVVRRHLPATSSGTSSLQAAQAAEAAGRQGKFDEMADLLFENQAIWSAEANPQLMFETYATTLGLNLTQFNADFVSTQVFSRINRDLTAAAQLEIADTPGIFLDGQLIENLPSDPSGLAERIELAVASNDTPIAIDRTTGELFVRRPAAFDFLDNQRFVFDVLTRDGGGHAAHNTLTIFVLPGGTDIPVAIDDAYTVNANGVLQVEAANGVLANDVGDNGQALTANLVGNATHGTVSLQLDGSFTYQPTTDFTGTDQFTYLVIAGSFVSPLANVVITVNPEGPQNLLPIAVNDSYRVQVNGTLSVAAVDGVLKNDSDPDSNSLAASLIDYPTHGTAVLATNGAFQYTPLLDFVGTDEFRYVVSDGQASSQAQVVIEVFEATAPEQNGGEAEGEGESSPITDLIDTLFEDDLTDWLEPSLIR